MNGDSSTSLKAVTKQTANHDRAKSEPRQKAKQGGQPALISNNYYIMLGWQYSP
jgi:hypothetical protein